MLSRPITSTTHRPTRIMFNRTRNLNKLTRRRRPDTTRTIQTTNPITPNGPRPLRKPSRHRHPTNQIRNPDRRSHRKRTHTPSRHTPHLNPPRTLPIHPVTPQRLNGNITTPTRTPPPLTGTIRHNVVTHRQNIGTHGTPTNTTRTRTRFKLLSNSRHKIGPTRDHRHISPNRRITTRNRHETSQHIPFSVTYRIMRQSIQHSLNPTSHRTNRPQVNNRHHPTTIRPTKLSSTITIRRLRRPQHPRHTNTIRPDITNSHNHGKLHRIRNRSINTHTTHPHRTIINQTKISVSRQHYLPNRQNGTNQRPHPFITTSSRHNKQIQRI